MSPLARCLAPAVLATMFLAPAADAGSLRIGLHALRLEPQSDVEEYADASWGGGLEVSYPLSTGQGWVSLTGELAIVNFRSETLVRTDSDILLRTEQTNQQNLFRAGMGLRLGPTFGPIQPYAGVTGYFAAHGISSKLVVPNDANPDNVIEQDLGSSNDGGMGWSGTAGVNIPLAPVLSVYGGATMLRLYGIDQPLGEDEVTIDPEYWEIHFGLAFSPGSMVGR